MATKTYRLTCTGDTRQARQALKARKWTYDPKAQAWYMMLVEAHAQRVLDGDPEFIRSLGGCRKGCRLVLSDGASIRVVWTSKTYAERQQAAGHADPDQDGCGWNVDAAGNPVAMKRIHGSSPDDRI